MCIVIDTNTFAAVFDRESQNHNDFRPVLDWIVYGNGKIVYGGTKYKEELRRARKFLGIISQLSKVSKVKEIPEAAVDARQREVESMVVHPDFDDPHLVAIIGVSGCRLICTGDFRAYRFLKSKSFYPKHVERPKIYRNAANQDLLCDDNIAEICRPCIKLNKKIANGLGV